MTSFNILLSPVVSYVSILLSKPYSKHFDNGSHSKNPIVPQAMLGTEQLAQPLIVTEEEAILKKKNVTVMQCIGKWSSLEWY